jgi:chemotaxis protein methyltransferase CheR
MGRGLAAAAADAEATDLLGEAEFDTACRLIAAYAGIKLSPHKRYMVHNRLSRRVRALGLGSFAEYLDRVQGDEGEREAFVNALTTNLTAFFREPHHFEMLRVRAETHKSRETRPLRVWCSACSTGEEAWSIAMTLREAGCRAQVLASDIDTEALEKAERGIYPLERTASLDPQRMKAHWLRGVAEYAGYASVRPELRTLVHFMPVNLLAAWPPMEPFDVIFCRNVVIYFDREAQKRLLARFAGVLNPGGLLAIGHAESFPAGHPGFRPCGRTAYEYRPG